MNAIIEITKNRMGTTTIDAKFPGMRKAQDFTVYPIKENSFDGVITVQSDTRIGKIDLNTGDVVMSKSHSNGAYFPHLMEATKIYQLNGEELLMLKANILATANAKAGTNKIVYTDNSGAIDIFSM